MQNVSHEFALYENELTDEILFYMNGVAQRLVLKQRHRAIQKLRFVRYIRNSL